MQATKRYCEAPPTLDFNILFRVGIDDKY